MTHSNTNPRSGQYLTHAHRHIIRAVAAVDSCFGLVRPHQHGIAAEQNRTRRVQSTPLSASSTQHMWELVANVTCFYCCYQRVLSLNQMPEKSTWCNSIPAIDQLLTRCSIDSVAKDLQSLYRFTLL